MTKQDKIAKALKACLLRDGGSALKDMKPKQIALSGPSGFLGQRVLDSILSVHKLRHEAGLEPGEVVLLSSSPGNLMKRLTQRYGEETMRTIRASRVDYYKQHCKEMWVDQLGSLGMGGTDAVFVNCAGIAGPIPGRPNAMMDVNYTAPVAAANACVQLGFGHWIQSSTQATKAERAGQVPYSRWKAMADYALARLDSLPVSILTMGLLYCKNTKVLGQRGDRLNMIDLALLPVTPIMGNGLAPLQPLEVWDAAERVAFLALTEPSLRPIQDNDISWADSDWTKKATSANNMLKMSDQRKFTLRMYDAVGPDNLSIIDLFQIVAKVHGKELTPVHVDYRNYERILNVASLGNLNRQFVSLLRSEQACNKPIVGNPKVFTKLLGDDAKLMGFEDALKWYQAGASNGGVLRREFPFLAAVRWVLSNPGVISPGLGLLGETASAYFARLRGRRRQGDIKSTTPAKNASILWRA